jgi:hypothetical protein
MGLATESANNALPPITVLVMATREDHPGLRNARDSLSARGFLDLSSQTGESESKGAKNGGKRGELGWRVMGLGEEWTGWRQRMAHYRAGADAAAQKDPRALVVCMDAYDALALRNGKDLAQVFQSYGTDLVLSMERSCFSGCGFGNCVSVRDWWRTDGRPHLEKAGIRNGVPGRDRYVNGGLLMGKATAVRALYDWMLQTDQTDDQIGLALYALAHRDRWAPDIRGLIFKNKIFGAQLDADDLAGKGAFFAHFPGFGDYSAAGYDRAVNAVLNRPSGMTSKNRGSMKRYIFRIIMTVVACLLTLILVALFVHTLVTRTPPIASRLWTPPSTLPNAFLPVR